MEGDQRSLSAIMLTDIVGYSALNQTNEELALCLLGEHNALIRQVLRAHDGREIKTIGDAFLVEFRSALGAVNCAIAIQQALRTRNESAAQERKVRVRIGVHLGDIVHRENDVFGDGVNIAARIEPLAPPEGICISEPVRSVVHNKIPLKTASIGLPKLKNIDCPIELHHVLLPWSGPTGPKSARPGAEAHRTSLIVLPLQNMSADPEHQYLCDGITVELTNGLARIEGLKVIARATAFSFKGQEVDVRQLAERLGVTHVVDGSVWVQGEKVRATVQLSDAREAAQLLSVKLDRKIDDIFALQDELALAVIDRLKLKLLKSESPVDVHTRDPEAYMLYLRGRHFWSQRSRYGFEKAIPCFEESLARDPRNPLPYVGLADTYNLLTDDTGVPARETYPVARRFIEQALEIDDAVSESHATMGYINSLREWDWTSADRHFQKAIDLNPNNANAHLWYAFHFGGIGKYAEALAQCHLAYELDPFHIGVVADLGFFHCLDADYDGALQWLQRAQEMVPSYWLAEWFKCLVYLHQGDFQAMHRAAQNALRNGGVPSWCHSHMGVALWNLRDHEAARAQLAEMRVSPAISFDLGIVHLAMGDVDEAFDCFTRAAEEMDLRVCYARHYPCPQDVTKHPRYGKLMARLNLA
jgi:adenylate cyclase